MIQLQDLEFSIAEKAILRNLSLTIEEGKFIGIIGPNGSGKTTMLKMLYRHLKQTSGSVTLHEKEIWDISPKKLAQQMAVVSQESPVLFDFTVKDLVMMGRTPYKKWLSSDNVEDFKIVEECMALSNVTHLADRTFVHLSGGEKKRVMLARALAQKAKILVLDEPTNHLDIEHQLHLMDLVKDLPITIITALHDLNLAAAYCDEVIVMKDGTLYGQGTPKQVFTEQTMLEVFRVHVGVSTNPFTDKLHLFFYTKQ
ncbi:iron ABC transporter [Solibacillus sp. R5-41]|uniref:ABC transporter ATP-binding protein n=1 Tax=Solibacillus sp. R5-41 TaxID=2048654 RepID=UPI000C125057|nr:ABC transporter ATP-binding protein [Solibacillus sp. R5-41]ATP38690.1 iron ABC transporter [Solibacillus sp. R5-41]